MDEKPMDETPPLPPIGTPTAGTPPYLTGVPPVLLKGTSQGRRRDIPPENWVPEELRRYGVVGTKNVLGSNLKGAPHPIFDRERWPGMDDRRFEALHQSIRLASILLEIGMPYLASFLPESNFRPDLTPRSKPWQPLEVIDIRKKVTESELDIAKNELNEIARNLEWREDPDIFDGKGWWGITASSYPRTTANFGTSSIIPTSAMDKKLKRDGFTRRTCTVGICSQYVDTLLRSDRASEQHLCAAFHLAVTLVHELGHVVFWQNISNSPVLSMGYEPSIDSQPYQELGFAFTGWMFGGWNPQPIIDDKSADNLFRQGMYWDKHLSDLKRPKWKVNYSMPFEFVHRLMTQSTWDAWMDNLCHPKARSIVLPVTPFRYGQDARAARCEKVETPSGWNWKKKITMEARFESEDDYEVFKGMHPGTMLPGIPPFGFVDEDWTAGPEAENYGDYHPYEPEKEVPLGSLFPSQLNAAIKVTYAGIYHQGTKTVLVDPNDGGNGQAGYEPTSNSTQYQGWTEGVLRDLCARLDLSSIGTKDELAARLAHYDESNGANTAGATGDKAAPGNTEPAKPLFFSIDWETKVSAFKKRLFERTGIPVDLQLLQLQSNKFIESGTGDATLRDLKKKYEVCEEIRLYRLQSEEKPDPGPLAPPSDGKRKPTALTIAPTPFHIAIIDDASASPRILADYHPSTYARTTTTGAGPILPSSIPPYILSLGVLSPSGGGGGPSTTTAVAPLSLGYDLDIDAGWADKQPVYRRVAEELERECHDVRANTMWLAQEEAEDEYVGYLQLVRLVLAALKGRSEERERERVEEAGKAGKAGKEEEEEEEGKKVVPIVVDDGYDSFEDYGSDDGEFD